MNLNQLYMTAKSRLEQARNALVKLTDGMKTTNNTDLAAVMKVATSVAQAEGELAELANSWQEAAAEQAGLEEAERYNDIPFLREALIYREASLDENEIGGHITFDFSKFMPEDMDNDF